MSLSTGAIVKVGAFLSSVRATLSNIKDFDDFQRLVARAFNIDLDAAASAKLDVTLDPTALFYVQIAVGVVGSVMVVVIVYGFYWLLSDPVSAKYGKKPSGKDAKKKQGAAQQRDESVSSDADGKGHHRNGTRGATPPPSAQPSATTAPEPTAPSRTRSRPLNIVAPNSTIKGFTRVGVLLTSPCQNHFIVSCRKSLKARRYPQSSKKEFMDRGRDLTDKAFTSLAPFINPDGNDKADVANATFSADGRFIVLGDAARDELHVFTCPTPGAHGKVGDLIPLWTYKLPNHQVVATLPTYGVMRNGEILSFCDEKECGVSLVHRGRSGKGTPVGTEQKVKVGKPTAYAMSENFFVVGGSFPKECRIHYYDIRHDAVNFALNKCFDAIAMKCKVSKVFVTTPGTPSTSTVEWLVLFMESGQGFVFDIPYAKRDLGAPASLVATFSDPDFANGNIDGMTVAMRGHEYHERLTIALWHQGDISVFAQHEDFPCQSGSTRVSKGPVPEIPHLIDFHNAHDGMPVKRLCFVQHGLGLATSGEDGDGTSIRLWALPLDA